MNEKGMVIPTVMILMMVLAALLTGTAYITRNQVRQLTLTQDSYKVKSMVELAVQTLNDTVEKEEVNQMTVEFNQGIVEITRMDEESYQAVGQLHNGTRYEKTIQIVSQLLELQEEAEVEELRDP